MHIAQENPLNSPFIENDPNIVCNNVVQDVFVQDVENILTKIVIEEEDSGEEDLDSS